MGRLGIVLAVAICSVAHAEEKPDNAKYMEALEKGAGRLQAWCPPSTGGDAGAGTAHAPWLRNSIARLGHSWCQIIHRAANSPWSKFRGVRVGDIGFLAPSWHSSIVQILEKSILVDIVPEDGPRLVIVENVDTDELRRRRTDISTNDETLTRSQKLQRERESRKRDSQDLGATSDLRSAFCYEVTGTRAYTTVTGETNKVFVLRRVHVDAEQALREVVLAEEKADREQLEAKAKGKAREKQARERAEAERARAKEQARWRTWTRRGRRAYDEGKVRQGGRWHYLPGEEGRRNGQGKAGKPL